MHTLKFRDIILISVLLGIGAFWAFGRTQPIMQVETVVAGTHEVACLTCKGSGYTPCPECGRFGTLEDSVKCPLCHGTGKHQLTLKKGTASPCLQCRGTGKIYARRNCAHCKGHGRVECADCRGKGMLSNTASRKITTVKAQYSVCEKILTMLFIEPDPNARPQKQRDGSYRLIEEYLALKCKADGNWVSAWGPCRREQDNWIIPVEVAYKDREGFSRQRKMEFVICNREVINVRRPTTGGKSSG